MSRQIEQALLSLMPSQGDDLPPQLVGLAESLLAQSRHKASTLKAEEDIARPYACAHLACDRLKISLDLPPIAARPPIPPRNYKKLYDYLDQTLPGSVSTPRKNTPRQARTPGSRGKNGTAASGTQQERHLPSRGTPSKDASLAQFQAHNEAQTPTKSATRSSLRNVQSQQKPQLLPWIRPVTRFLCAETDESRLAPTVMAGMETITLPGGKAAADEWVQSNATALLAAVFFQVRMRAKTILEGVQVDRKTYVPVRKEILALLGRARDEATIREKDEAKAWEGWKTVSAKEFDAAIGKVVESEWLREDWYTGVVDVVTAQIGTGADAVEDADTAGFSQTGQIRRADTMLQSKFDYLSDERRETYKTWKASALQRIAEARAANEGAMKFDAA